MIDLFIFDSHPGENDSAAGPILTPAMILVSEMKYFNTGIINSLNKALYLFVGLGQFRHNHKTELKAYAPPPPLRIKETAEFHALP